ncbi:uncharacterized protein C8Q71DRAFT_837178 [Rhodofomes roseus]|uniref:Uncharacterized protein n=1 Tax=Rhodofomes roseus TaxID=34475 RepID=A0A4Y9YP67_9APHY|nr:uncharacterized protein C8Q71DRAFT_837178 [Rhodofomes roseus]KAH9835332.1 hypothetical protein C8Q71DRAFT_837178 [Rhodofomes roseus]TFY63640.1 hypothetical protein EVJ58_g3141 [Rhodofomes roseus]
MVFVSASVDVYLFTAIAVTLPVLFYLRQRNSGSRPEAPYEPYLIILVALHTLYILYTLILCWPFNLFSRLHIPLNASPDTIRSTLVRRAGLDVDAPLPRSLEELLTRLSAFEMRTLYVRFGQAVLQECEHCKTFNDYALFALPRAFLEYVREVAIIGMLTIRETGRERWRTYVVGALICAAVAEAYWIATAAIDVPENGLDVFMWHDMLWALRQLVFLVTPLLTHFLLPSTPSYASNPTAPAHAAQLALEQASRRLVTLRYTRGAVMRDPRMRAAAGDWWERQRVEGEWAREDETVRRVADRLGKGFDETGVEGEGRIRKITREAVASFRAGLVAAQAEPS